MYHFSLYYIMITQQTENQTMGIYGIYGTVWFGMSQSLGASIAELNIAFEILAMTMSRYVIFGAVICFISKLIFEKKND